MATQHAHYDPLAWWWTRHEVGQDLRELYSVPTELPPELLTLVRKLDDSDLLFPSISSRNERDFFP